MLRKYEAMFLFDPVVATDWDKVQAELGRLMERTGARVIASGKWDERRLAYEIRGRKRGVYALTYFEADAARIGELERDAGLSEAVLRCLVMRVDHLTEEEMKEAASRRPEEFADEGPRGDRPWSRRDARRPRRDEPPATSAKDRERKPEAGLDKDGGASSADEGAKTVKAADTDAPEE